MIIGQHPGIKLIEEAPFEFHLVGSRFVGKFDHNSDFDFLVVIESFYSPHGLLKWLQDNDFERAPGTYGTDRRLLSSDVWSRTWGGWPPIDLLPVSPAEAKMRLQWFEAMRAAGHRDGGLLAKALKASKAWPHLWEVLAEYAPQPQEDEGDDQP